MNNKLTVRVTYVYELSVDKEGYIGEHVFGSEEHIQELVQEFNDATDVGLQDLTFNFECVECKQSAL